MISYFHHSLLLAFSFIFLSLRGLSYSSEVELDKEYPNIEEVTRGVNVLLGETPSEQVTTHYGGHIFNFVRDPQLRGTRYAQLRLSEATSCSFESIENTVDYATSTSSLKWESSSASNGFNLQASIGLSDPKGLVSVETDIQNVLAFGNSESSLEHFAQQSRRFSYKFSARQQTELYTVRIEYDIVADYDSFTQIFKSSCSKLSADPSRENVFEFIKRFGTHAIGSATFGEHCESSVYMRDDFDMQTYQESITEARSRDIGFLFWKTSKTNVKRETDTSSFRNRVKFKVANRVCHGSTQARSANCDVRVPTRESENSPAIINWTYFPIWLMSLAELNEGAKNALKGTVQGIFNAANSCGDQYCNGGGYCGLRKDLWSQLNSAYVLSQLEDIDFYDTTRCFCKDGRVGKKCEYGRILSVTPPKWHPVVANGRRGPGNVEVRDRNNKRKLLCGIGVGYWKDARDMGFRAFSCEMEDPQKDLIQPAKGTEILNYNDRGRFTRFTPAKRPWTTECPDGYFMVTIGTKRLSRKEDHDRIFQFKCKKYDGVKHSKCKWTTYNKRASDFRTLCDRGYAMTGMRSKIDGKSKYLMSKRQYSFRCCSPQIKT